MSIARPLRQLTRAAVAFAAGETGLPMPPPRNDEIGELAAAFRVMMQRRREAEERVRQLADDLAEGRRRLADILDSVPAVVFEHWSMTDCRRNFVSSHVETMYGYTPEEWLSTPDFFAGRIHPEDRPEVLERAARQFAGNQVDGKQVFRWITKDNRVIWCETQAPSSATPTTGPPAFAASPWT